MDDVVQRHVNSLFPDEPDAAPDVMRLIERYRADVTRHRQLFSRTEDSFPMDNGDAILITGGDALRGPEERPLQYLYRFLDEMCDDLLSGVYVRPTPTPGEEDEGTDHRREDLEALSAEFRLMTDVPDLEFDTPETMLKSLDRFLELMARGVQLFRIDGNAFHGREGERHVLELYRRAMQLLDEKTLLVEDAEHRVAEHREVNEPSLLYDDTLPALLLDAVASEDATGLGKWIESLENPGPESCRFNIGAGAGDNSFLSALADPNLPDPQRARVFLSSQAVFLALAGVPGIPLESLLGIESRTELDFEALEAELADEDSLRSLVFSGYKTLLQARIAEPAFDPRSPQRVVLNEKRLLVIVRGPGMGAGAETATRATVVCLHNLSGTSAVFRDRRDRYPWPEDGVLRDLVSGDLVFPSGEGALFSLELEPWEVMWLRFGPVE